MCKRINELLNNNYHIVFDTNVFLHLYGYSPDFIEFSLNCLEAVKEKMILPSTVKLEFERHHNQEYRSMNKKFEKANRKMLDAANSAKEKMLSQCALFESQQLPDITEIQEVIIESFSQLDTVINNYFDDRNVLEQITSIQAKTDFVDELVTAIPTQQTLPCLSQKELYDICSDGENRYKKNLPPGFKDSKKSGLRKYSDLIIWKEILRYAKQNRSNIILVTDDIKADWWDSDGTFHKKLVSEFENKTDQKIKAYTSIDFFNQVATGFSIQKTDAIAIALNTTNETYYKNIADDVFDDIIDKIAFSDTALIDNESAHIGTEGIEELDVTNHDFIEAIQLERDDNLITYHFTYNISAEGVSFDYWGRDEDTKEIILSPGCSHEFKGEIFVEVTRDVETYYDFLDTTDYESANLLSGNLIETSYQDLDYEIENAFTTCPDCGCPINYDNDGGNGFCTKCAPNH